MKRKIFAISLTIVLVLLAGCNQDTSQLASSIAPAVPDVVGLTQDEAEARITNAGFVPEAVFVVSDKVPTGSVVKTDPDAGEVAELSSAVKLFVSKGEKSSATVPDVVGMSLEEATKVLSSKGLKVGDTRYKDSSKEKDTVILSDPLPGASVSGGSKVSLTLSSGDKSEKTLYVDVDVPESSSKIEFTVYIDGKLKSSYTKTADPSTETITFKFTGSSGKKEVRIMADGEECGSYTLDFDKGKVVKR